MERSIYFDIRRTIEAQNNNNLEQDRKKYRTKIRLLRKIFETGDLKAYYINGLYYKKKIYEAILCIHSKKNFIGETEGGLPIHYPATVQIFILRKIRDCAVTPEGLTAEERDYIISERKKPKRKRGDHSSGDFKKSINWLADKLNISNRRISAFCKRRKL